MDEIRMSGYVKENRSWIKQALRFGRLIVDGTPKSQMKACRRDLVSIRPRSKSNVGSYGGPSEATTRTHPSHDFRAIVPACLFDMLVETDWLVRIGVVHRSVG